MTSINFTNAVTELVVDDYGHGRSASTGKVTMNGMIAQTRTYFFMTYFTEDAVEFCDEDAKPIFAVTIYGLN